MSRRQIEDLLQECLSGYDHGLTPEECLAPFADRRDELEPLFRNALGLRMAFATCPDETFATRARDKLMFAAGREVQTAMAAEPAPEFKQRARDRFMFAAGREVSQALASDPDPEFAQDTRQKLIYAAGAAAQEALRNVPPPKLPFWVNTRRHLLEAAARPAVKPAHKPVSFAFSAGLSMAGVMAAVVLAMGAYFYTQSAPTSVGAEFAAIQEQTLQVNNQVANGNTVSPALLADLTRRTNELAARLQEETKPDVSDKLQPLIDIQRQAIEASATVSSIKPPADVQQLQAASQQLQQAEIRVQATRANAPSAVANSNTNTNTNNSNTSSSSGAGNSTQTQPQPPVQSQAPAPVQGNSQPTTTSPQPSIAATPAKSTTTTSTSNAPAAPVLAGQVRVRVLPTDNTLGMAWVEIRTANFRFVAPSSWNVLGLTTDANGIATANVIGFSAPDVSVIVNLTSGDFNGEINGQALTHFQSIEPQLLFTLAGDKALILRHMIDSR